MNRTMKIGLGVLIGLVVVIGLAGWQLGLFSADPEEANVEDLAEAVSGDDAVDGDDAERGEALTEIDGDWTVVALDEVFAGFRVDEVLSGVDFTAVARTSEVSGTLAATGTTISAAEITVDIASLKTDNGSRDRAIVNEALEASSFPTATFVLTEPIELGTIPSEGETVVVDAVGDLTIHGVTKNVTLSLDASQAGGLILVAGQLELTIADYDVDTPSAPMVASISETAILEVSLAFDR